MEEVSILKDFCSTPYQNALTQFKTFAHQQLMAKKTFVIHHLKQQAIEQIEASIRTYHQAHFDEHVHITCALDPQFHRQVYNAVLGQAQTNSPGSKEIVILKQHWNEFMQTYRAKQIKSFTDCLDKAKEYATVGLQ